MTVIAAVLHGHAWLVSALALIVLALVLTLDRHTGNGGKRRGARWATGRDLASLRVRRPRPGRIVLGRYRWSLLAAGERTSTVVLGPTQLSGKTSRVVIPAILEWDGPVLATSIKPDVLDATIRRREDLGEVKIFDPLSRTGLRTATWSPVAAAGSWSHAREIAAHVCQVGWESARQDRDPHWREAAARHLAPLLLAAHGGRRTLAQIGAWIDTGERDEPELLLRGSKDPDAPRALEVLGALWLKDARYASSVFATLEAALDPWLEPSVAAATAQPDITAEWLLSGSNTLFVLGAGQEQRRLASLYGGLLMAAVDEALSIAAANPGRRLDPPLLCALDEVANIAPVPGLAQYASAGLGPGVILLTVLQDYSQAVEHWGAERAQSILANHVAKLFCSGIADPATLRYVSDLLGHERVKQQSRHRGRDRSTTDSEHLEPLAPPHLIRQGKADTGLLLVGRYPPVWIRLRPYYRDPKLRRLAD